MQLVNDKFKFKSGGLHEKQYFIFLHRFYTFYLNLMFMWLCIVTSLQ